MKINKDTDALLAVDVQNDFVTGSLSVPNAREIIPIINESTSKFDTVIYSRDAHREGHPSFKAQGGPWPDHCVIDSVIDENATKIAQLIKSYTELSQSGTGIHIIAKAKKPGERCRSGNVEIYDNGRYFIMTGHRKSSLDIHERQNEIDAIYRTMFPTTAAPPKPVKTIPSRPDVEVTSTILLSPRYMEFRKLWMGDIAGYPSQSEADMAFCGILAQFSSDFDQIDRIFRRSGLIREKWDKKHGRQTYGERTIETALRG